jgi:hypothetical protein
MAATGTTGRVDAIGMTVAERGAPAGRTSVRRVDTIARRGGAGPVPVRPGGAGRPARNRAGGRSPVTRRQELARGAGGWPSAARPLSVSPVSRMGLRRPVDDGRGVWDAVRAVALTVAVAVLASLTVAGLGLLADATRSARVPTELGQVRVHDGESLWQVARRAAPSADPGAVAARIVELNDLASPSVPAGTLLESPIE